MENKMVKNITLNEVKSDSTDNIVLSIEKLQLLGYSSFWIIVLVGIFLTDIFANIDLDNTLLLEVFGYNNICIYFDFPPSTYILPLLWSVTLVFLLLYLVTNWLQMKKQVKVGNLDQKLYKRLTKLKIFEAFTLVSFSTIFAVSPEGWNHTLIIHTAPFLLLQVGVVSIAISNTLFGIKSGYWDRIGMTVWFTRVNILYCILFSSIVGLYIPILLNAMGDSLWLDHIGILKSIAEILDRCFLFFAAIVPILNAYYLLCFKADKLENVKINL